MRANWLKVFALILLLSGCSNVRISSNTGDWVETGFRAGKVKTYSFEELMSYNHRYLGSLNEEYCHTEKIDPAPSVKHLERQLKADVQELGGNAIVLEPCEKLSNYGSCTTLLRCQATAYVIDFDGV